MTTQLTTDQIAAMEASSPSEPLVFIDAQSHKEYVLFDKGVYERWVAQQVNVALDEADAGLDETWEIANLKNECRAELAKSSGSSPQ